MIGTLNGVSADRVAGIEIDDIDIKKRSLGGEKFWRNFVLAHR